MTNPLILWALLWAGIDALDSSEWSDIGDLVDGAAIGAGTTVALWVLASVLDL